MGVHILDTTFDCSSEYSQVSGPGGSRAGDTCIKLKTREEDFRQFKSIDVEVLCAIAAKLKGANCNLLPELTCIGASNLVVFLAFDDEKASRWTARFPLLGLCGLTDDAALLAEKIESMVTTMQYVAKHTTIPVPTIYHWDSSFTNELGRPYVLMDAVKGKTLYQLDRAGINMENAISTSDLSSFIDQWAKYNVELTSLKFDSIGALRQDENGDIYVHRLCTRKNLHFTQMVKVDRYRGPFHSVSDYILTMSELKTHALSSDPNTGIKYTFHSFLKTKLVESMLPYYVDQALVNGPFVLSHIDFDIQNILVDETDGFKITGVIDWDFASVVPLQSHIRVPSILMCDRWTESRQRRKYITPLQIKLAETYRDHYKLCFKQHLSVRQNHYPLDTLLENGDLFERFERFISQNQEDEEFDLLWSHVYGMQMNWKGIIKTMETADWGTVMAERLSLPIQVEDTGAVSESEKNMPSRPETHDTFVKSGTQNPIWTKRVANKLRWSWWHIEQCLLCRMNSKRVPILMRKNREGNEVPSNFRAIMTNLQVGNGNKERLNTIDEGDEQTMEEARN